MLLDEIGESRDSSKSIEERGAIIVSRTVDEAFKLMNADSSRTSGDSQQPLLWSLVSKVKNARSDISWRVYSRAYRRLHSWTKSYSADRRNCQILLSPECRTLFEKILFDYDE